MRRSKWSGIVCAAVGLAVLAIGAATAPGAQSDAVDIAIAYVNDNKQELGLTGADVKDMVVTSKVADTDTGTTHVYLQQTHKGIGVHGGRLLAPDADVPVHQPVR